MRLAFAPCVFALTAITLFWSAGASILAADSSDAFTLPVGGLQLENQTIVDGIAMLSQSKNVAYSVELPLGRTIAESAPALRTVTSSIKPGTLTNVLDQLCALDSTFAWKRIANTVHLYPRSLETDQSYLFNKKISVLNLKDVPDAQDAVFKTVAQLEGPKEQIALMQSGVSIIFSHPWTASFNDITVREVFDKIAQQLGPTYGWQFGGASDFRVLTFHERLSVKPKAPPVQ
jgi:hypothetical protein